MNSGVRWTLFAMGVLLGASLLAQVDLADAFLSEPRRWRIAEAERLWFDKQQKPAVQSLLKTLKQGTTSLEELGLLSRWALRCEDYEAVHWACDRAEEMVSLDVYPMLAQRFASYRAFAFYRQHEPEKALECWQPFETLEPFKNDPSYLNGYAYLRALVGLELEDALTQAEEALRDYRWTEVERLQRLAQVNLNLNQNIAALDYIRSAAKIYGPLNAQLNVVYDREMARWLSSPLLGDDDVERQIQQLRSERETQALQGILLRLQKAEALQRIGETQAASKERESIRLLGYNPEELTYLIYDDQQLEGYAAFMDTRGWIKFRQGRWSEAISDLKQAIECAEPLFQQQQRVVEVNLQRRVHAEDFEDRWMERRRGLAVMYDHLAQAYYELGELKQAEQCENRVRQLGFQVGPHLY